MAIIYLIDEISALFLKWNFRNIFDLGISALEDAHRAAAVLIATASPPPSAAPHSQPPARAIVTARSGAVAMLSGLFGRTRRTPADVTKALRDALAAGRAVRDDADVDDKARQKASDAISSSLRSVKEILSAEAPSGGGGAPASADAADGARDSVGELVRIAQRTDLLLAVAKSLELMEFEARKDAVQVFNNLMRRGLSTPADAAAKADGEADEANHLVGDAGAILECLVQGYDNAEIALNCGSMLRECVRSESMARVLVESQTFWRFFDLVELNDFDVASDAFASFKEALTRHVAIAASFMERNLDQFMTSYNLLLRSQNYVTRRQSLKLLGEMLIERANFKIMTRYIASATNLRLIMYLLLDQRKNIQFETFHVFKVFVANPKKTLEVRQILLRNKDRLLSYLKDFLSDRVDEQFHVDRNLILEEIRTLAPLPEPAV